MVKWSAVALITLSILHMLVLGHDLPGELPDWLGLSLWTFEHWQPMRSQGVDLALSNGIFWSTIGSFAVPLLLLAALILWMDRRGQQIPPFVGWSLAAWALLATGLMLPSGFPLALIITVCLAVGLRCRARSA
jgi:hypothetical protein